MISLKVFLIKLKESMATITHERYFLTERGYQAELYAQLKCRLKGLKTDIVASKLIVEAEYQKTQSKHQLGIRPDLIIHVPHEVRGDEDYKKDNYYIVQLKLRANKGNAHKDFDNLDKLIETLKYKFGVFLNIDSENTFAEQYEGEHSDKILCYAVRLQNGKVQIKQQKPRGNQMPETS